MWGLISHLLGGGAGDIDFQGKTCWLLCIWGCYLNGCALSPSVSWENPET